MSTEHFSLDEICLLTILSEKNKLTTKEILDHMKKYPDICQTCVSGTTVIVAGKKLIRKGYIKRSPVSGGFEWELIKTPPPLQELLSSRKR